MYKMEFLPIAKKDIDDIFNYISFNLKNKTASKKLRDLFMKSFDNIIKFPYRGSIYKLSSNLKYEYRSYRVKNFLLFYLIDEKQKSIIIVRILYQKMDIKNILE